MGSRFTEEHTAEMGKLEQLAEVEGREGNMQGIFTDNFGM
jgi:hypothetical protein